MKALELVHSKEVKMKLPGQNLGSIGLGAIPICLD